MLLESFATGPLQSNCTLLADEQTREALLVDPGDEAGKIARRIAAHGLALKRILLTHAHLDHVGAAFALRRLSGAPVSLHRDDLPLLESVDSQAAWLGMNPPEKGTPDHWLDDNAIVGLPTIPLKVLHTPGHTQGGVCFYHEAENLLIAGDTLFLGSVGRTDLPGGNMEQLMRSIHTRLLPLPDETRVICGHGPATTLGRERQTNPFLR